MYPTQIFCQSIDSASLNIEQNTVLQDSTNKHFNPSNPFDTVEIAIKEDEIEKPVLYEASDSIVYDIEAKKLYLYGDAKMDYGSTKVNAELVDFDWTSQTLSAQGVDSAGQLRGTPVLDQEGKLYEAKKMDYNFKTQKGKIYDVVTEDNGAYIHSEIVKKTTENHWLSYKTKYTTCTNKEHPHFYIAAKKAKIIPDKVMLSGPADLVISGINTPLALPFAIFPLQKGKRSGLIIPKLAGAGDFFTAREGGYFWAVNDYFNLKLLGEIITDGTFGLSLGTQYAKKYKFSGDIFASYRRVVPADPILNPNRIQNDFNFTWTHRLDLKANPNHNFSAALAIRSNRYSQNQVVQTREVLQAINQSNINYIRRFNGKPYTLSINANFLQNIRTNSFDVTLPEIVFNVNKITPFKSKINSEKKKFYERIGISYSAKAKSTIATVDTAIFTRQTLESLNYGIEQDLNLDATYSLFKYINVTPRFDYKEQWFFQEETLSFDPSFTQINDSIFDTTYINSTIQNGFFARRNFSASIALSTKLTGIYNFKNSNLKAIRHVLTPRISYNYNPDFSNSIWNYYNSYFDERDNRLVEYNQYANRSVYTTPGGQEQNALNLFIGNAFEMKVKDNKDSTQSFKKIPLLRTLNFSTGYNFAGDSTNKFQNIVISANTSLLNGLFALRSSLVYNPYSRSKNNTRIQEFYWNTDNKILRFESFNLTVDLNLNGRQKQKNSLFDNEYGSIEEQQFVARNPQLFYDFDIPWSFYAKYHFSLRNGSVGDKDLASFEYTNFSFGGDINITPKWKIAIQSGYNFRDQDFTLTNVRLLRDLHCWEMSLNWQAYPIRSSYFLFEINVKSALLQDLKLSRRNVRYNNLNSF